MTNFDRLTVPMQGELRIDLPTEGAALRLYR